MPHVTVKLWPGKSEEQKRRLAEEITQSVTSILGYGADSVSVAIQEVASSDWRTEVYEPDIRDRPSEEIYREPGYSM